MRRFFYALVFIAVAVAFFQSDLAEDLFYEYDGTMTNWFNKLSDSAEAVAMAAFKDNAAPILKNLKAHQIEYAEHVMKDRETLGVFYMRYCEGDDKNPYLFGQSLTQFCDLIGKEGILKQR